MQIEDYFDFLSPEEIRIKGHRIGLEDVLEEYFAGMSAEQLAERFHTLSLEEIYATLLYYHANREKVKAYYDDHVAWCERRQR